MIPNEVCSSTKKLLTGPARWDLLNLDGVWGLGDVAGAHGVPLVELVGHVRHVAGGTGLKQNKIVLNKCKTSG